MTWFDRLLSTFGYQALDLILGIDTREISETELRQLVRLAGYMVEHEELWTEVQDTIVNNMDLTPNEKIEALRHRAEMITRGRRD